MTFKRSISDIGPSKVKLNLENTIGLASKLATTANVHLILGDGRGKTVRHELSTLIGLGVIGGMSYVAFTTPEDLPTIAGVGAGLGVLGYAIDQVKEIRKINKAKKAESEFEQRLHAYFASANQSTLPKDHPNYNGAQ